jgi:aminoglycoside phosphotransferase (APT) family kinase protein
MQLIDEANVADYLRSTGRIGTAEPVRVRELTGGVSNMVLLVERPAVPGADLVVKQARAQLRTREPWYSSVERIWREADVLRSCTELLASAAKANDEPLAARTPEIIFEDRANYLLAMRAAPRPNVVWKNDLLAGQADPTIAAACGRLLATLHGQGWSNTVLAERLADRTLFNELRVDPYYRTLAAAHPPIRPAIERLIDSLDANVCTLVHADFSPKNLLVFDQGLMMVDFETGHYGDPAFDLGFFLSHLVLKASLHAPGHGPYLQLTLAFQTAYDETLAPRIGRERLAALWARGVQNFAGCAWARLDGKSPVEYLNDEQRREPIRELCQTIFAERPLQWSDVVALCRARMDRINPSH